MAICRGRDLIRGGSEERERQRDKESTTHDLLEATERREKTGYSRRSWHVEGRVGEGSSPTEHVAEGLGNASKPGIDRERPKVVGGTGKVEALVKDWFRNGQEGVAEQKR